MDGVFPRGRLIAEMHGSIFPHMTWYWQCFRRMCMELCVITRTVLCYVLLKGGDIMNDGRLSSATNLPCGRKFGTCRMMLKWPTDLASLVQPSWDGDVSASHRMFLGEWFLCIPRVHRRTMSLNNKKLEFVLLTLDCMSVVL